MLHLTKDVLIMSNQHEIDMPSTRKNWEFKPSCIAAISGTLAVLSLLDLLAYMHNVLTLTISVLLRIGKVGRFDSTELV